MTATPTPVPPTHVDVRPTQWQIVAVLARVLENLAAGVGVGVFAVAVAWAIGVPFESYQWPAVVGLGWFGLLSAVRFSHDEARVAYLEVERAVWRDRARQLDAENDALDALLLERDREIDALNARIAARPNFVPAQPERVDPTMRDAEQLVRLRYGDGARVSRRLMQERGWSEDRYRAALSILRVARVVGGEERNPLWAEYDSPAAALVALATPPIQPEVGAFSPPVAASGEGEGD